MRRPLVLTASVAAVEQARALNVSGCLENRIEEAIIAGRLPGTSVGSEAPVSLGDGVIAICAKVRTVTGRKGWKALAVRSAPPSRTPNHRTTSAPTKQEET